MVMVIVGSVTLTSRTLVLGTTAGSAGIAARRRHPAPALTVLRRGACGGRGRITVVQWAVEASGVAEASAQVCLPCA